MTCKSATEIAKSVTVLDAVLVISKEATLINCFDKAGYSEFQEIIETDIIESKKIKRAIG